MGSTVRNCVRVQLSNFRSKTFRVRQMKSCSGKHEFLSPSPPACHASGCLGAEKDRLQIPLFFGIVSSFKFSFSASSIERSPSSGSSSRRKFYFHVIPYCLGHPVSHHLGRRRFSFRVSNMEMGKDGRRKTHRSGTIAQS